MRSSVFLAFLLNLVALCLARSVDSRTITRASENGAVNLVEFNIRGVLHGQCSYINDDGYDVSIIYEEFGNDMKARSSIVSQEDPVTEARKCRSFAIKSPSDNPGFRAGIQPIETEEEVLDRLYNVQARIAQNQNFVQHLTPRFIQFVPSTTTTTTNTNKFNIFNKPGVTIAQVPLQVPVFQIPYSLQPHTINVPTFGFQQVTVQKPVLGR